jgi:hypothetical protein
MQAGHSFGPLGRGENAAVKKGHVMNLPEISTFPIPCSRNMPVRRIMKAFTVGVLIVALLFPAATRADGVAEVKSCEADNSPPEDFARLTILPNGESRGSNTAASLIQMARQKAKEGKDDEAIRWALLCKLDVKEQDPIKRDSAAVLQYLKQ